MTIMTDTTANIAAERKVSIPLALGTLFMPYVFGWLLLRPGYSPTARTIGLGWTAIVIATLAFGFPKSNTPLAGAASSQVEIDPGRADKMLAVAAAKQVVPSVLRDPSSADFGVVWGMSASVACGSVNGKNAFGAKVGQTRFIFENGRVALENGQGGFANRWNATCIDKPNVPAPSGVGGNQWGSRPSASLKQFAPATDDGLAVYVPKGVPQPLEGVDVAEADYSFDRGRLYSADFYIDGVQGRDAIVAAFVKKYGTPQSYDEGASQYAWKWPGNHNTVNINYNAEHGRTTVHFDHK